MSEENKAKRGQNKAQNKARIATKKGESKKSQKSNSHKNNSRKGESHKVESRILFLAINEREKSLKFYESLCGFKNDFNGVDSLDSANPQSANLQNFVDENLCTIFMRIAKKEREMLANASAILQKIRVDSSVDSNDLSVDSNDLSVDSADSNADSSADSSIDSSESILLPSALPDDILGELLSEMGDLTHLNILALGVESHHLKTCDFLIKTAQQITADAQIIDILYQLQALSYNHHIPLLNGESPKENANPNSTNPSANQALPPLLSDLLKQSPLLNEFKSALDSLQNIYAQTKDIVQKLERGELSQDELVAFLQKLRF